MVFQTRRRLLSDKLHRGWSSVRVVIFRTEQKIHSVTAAAVVNAIDHTKDVQILPLLYSIPECSFLGTKKLSFPIFKNIFWLFNLFLKIKSNVETRKKKRFFRWFIGQLMWCFHPVDPFRVEWSQRLYFHLLKSNYDTHPGQCAHFTRTPTGFIKHGSGTGFYVFNEMPHSYSFL